MSNKKISELELVTSNASGDQFVLVQNGETMRTTMSKIYDYLASAFNVSNYYTKPQTDVLLAAKQNDYDISNTATGANAVTINEPSGLAVFTQTLSKKSNAYYEINNILAEEGITKVECNLFYSGAGFPVLMHYKVEAGKIRFHIGNIAVDGGSGIDTNANLEITFRLI